MLRKAGVVDVPNRRSSHVAPTPRGAGLACLLAAGLAIAGHKSELLKVGSSGVIGALTCVLCVALIGLIDDVKSLDPLFRLLGQVAIGGVAGSVLGGWWLILAGGIIMPLLVNVVNFMDGINGLTGISTAVWGLSYVYLGTVKDVDALALIGAVAAGSAIGFLPFNVPRARIFLGDSGSYLYGGLAAVGTLVGLRAGLPWESLLAPFAILLADVAVTLIRRGRAGKPLLKAHREHVYQRLTTLSGRKWPHWVVSCLVGILSLGVSTALIGWGGFVGVGLTVMLVGIYVTFPQIAGRYYSRAPE
jgi:UDP-N-acetylmuramyl pentapeptide phosphotransferase/UDP-N-acetylglucosamine-1-phosphate transferase